VKTRAVGHTGTLDPFATGLLVVLVGRGTRVARFVEAQRKTYLATARLGIATDTDDRTGAVVRETRTALPSDTEIVDALRGFLGPQRQRPPAYSAKRVAGQRSHRLARRGLPPDLEPVAVTIHVLEVLGVAGAEVTFRVTASAGTYIRALARDLGECLGVGGHLAELRRETIGHLSVEHAVPMAGIEPGIELQPLSTVLEHLPSVVLTDQTLANVAHGRAIAAPGQPDGWVVLLAGAELAAVGLVEHGRVHPRVVLVQQ